MTAQQIQTIGNALAADLVAWGTAAIGLALGGRRGGLGVAAAALSAGPALVGEAVVAFFGEDEMVQQRNAKQISRLAEPFGQDAIFWAGCDITRGMVVSAEPSTGIHEDQRLEDFAGMHNGQGQRSSGDHIDPDEPMLRIQATDEELLPVQTRQTKAGGSPQRLPTYAPIPQPEWHGPRARGSHGTEGLRISEPGSVAVHRSRNRESYQRTCPPPSEIMF
jgi:hypothetical protein